mmetsp:Transcript_41971/g.78515  ORF Transcript_41971/g.78515 Transcript_41971/m.78515 type:complete len:217 (-) Transcript_41971:400-1050(-)
MMLLSEGWKARNVEVGGGGWSDIIVLKKRILHSITCPPEHDRRYESFLESAMHGLEPGIVSFTICTPLAGRHGRSTPSVARQYLCTPLWHRPSSPWPLEVKSMRTTGLSSMSSASWVVLQSRRPLHICMLSVDEPPAEGAGALLPFQAVWATTLVSITPEAAFAGLSAGSSALGRVLAEGASLAPLTAAGAVGAVGAAGAAVAGAEAGAPPPARVG